MTATVDPANQHPAPHRRRADIRLLLLGLAAGPFAWIVQLVLGYGLASSACYSRNAPRLRVPPSAWVGEHRLLLAINLVCLAIALAGAGVSWLSWRRTRQEKAGGTGMLLEIGEGRTRFLAACGTLAAAGFAVAILFDTAEPFIIASCWRIAS
jgi:hypothetical protein